MLRALSKFLIRFEILRIIGVLRSFKLRCPVSDPFDVPNFCVSFNCTKLILLPQRPSKLLLKWLATEKSTKVAVVIILGKSVLVFVRQESQV